MPRKVEVKQDPRFERKSYMFDLGQLERLKRIARERSTAENKVYIAGVIREALSEYLERHDHRNGTSAKS